MAENQKPVNHEALERRLVLMPPGSSTKDMSTSGASDLHPNSLGHVTSSSNLSSLTVPVRLDVLYFLLNSAAKGAQNALAPLPIQSGQGSVSACHGLGASQAGSCCNSCQPTCHKASGSAPYAWHPSTPHRDDTVYRNSYSHGSGIPDRQHNQRARVAQWDGGKNWSGSPQADPARGWKRSQSPLGWKERQRDEGGRYWKGDNWQRKEGNFRKSWSNPRESLAESTPWSSGSPNSKREGASFGEHTLNVKRKRDGNCWQEMCDGPKGQRYSTHGQIEWPRKQGPQQPASVNDNTAVAEMTTTTGQDKAEDWEAEYQNIQETASAPECFSNSSLQDKEMNTSEAGDSYDIECAPSTDLLKQKLETSPLPKSLSQDQAATSTEMEPTASDSDWKKNGRFAHYLLSLYSDVPEKSSSECSTDLTIDIDPEKSRPEEEEAMKGAPDEESKPLA
ncbi:uncharacterized protein LOC113423258 [Notechis scutatus]|uniref:Uncharacterized protein LOC113423258 n=1 Tax=Notechis scutatus TaxID=8663 RepID=A0A6J1VC75_9SAUR|nr:uncharacterized protein LOC113423258 [Notechis scutatus]